MSYEIDAFLGKSSDLRNWNVGLSAAVAFDLTAELGLVPLTSELVRALQRHLAAGGQSKDELVHRWCIEASRGTVVAFVSANYFGGQGGQSAAVWANQKIVKSNVSINSALQSLGVRAAGRDDEFDTVGLGRFRRTESWTAAERIRRLVAEMHGQRGAEADDAISALLAQATESQGEVAIWLEAACALAKIGGKAIPALAALLVPGALPNRGHIVRALGEAGPQASVAVPELMNVLKADDDDRVHTEAASTLGKIGGDARSAVPVLIDALRDPSVVIRREAVWALERSGRPRQQ